jgi:hypothetical protein
VITALARGPATRCRRTRRAVSAAIAPVISAGVPKGAWEPLSGAWGLSRRPPDSIPGGPSPVAAAAGVAEAVADVVGMRWP